jgi:hypothetical protein
MNNAAKVAADTSGAFTIEVTPKTNLNANGTYYMPYMDYDYFTPPGVLNTHIFNLTMDGAGLFDHTTYVSSQNPPPLPAANVPYSVSPDGQIIAGNARGVISDDDSMLLLAETIRSEKILGMGLAIKPTSGQTNAVLEGTYVMGEVGRNTLTGASWIGRYTVTVDSPGNATVQCVDMTGGCQFTPISFTYTISDDTNGKSAYSDSLGHTGIVSSDGKVFSMVDADALLDNTIAIGVGMKTSSGGLSDTTMAGKFIAATFGISVTHGPWVDIFQVKLNGKGGGTATELYTSWPPLTPTHPVIYSIGADGSLGLGPTGTEVQGIAMEDGQGFLVVDTISTGESSLTIGLKKAK